MSKPRQKKNILAALAGIAVVAAVAASASTLGGLTTDRIGADTAEVTAPVTEGVTVDWQTTYSATERQYVIDDLRLTANEGKIPPGAEVRVTLQGDEGQRLAEYLSHDGGSTFEAPGAVPAHDVHGAAVVIVD